MKEPIPYRQPETPDSSGTPPSPKRILQVGLLICGASIVPIVTPLFLKMPDLQVYLVVLGLAGLMLGINCLINAAIDWLRGG